MLRNSTAPPAEGSLACATRSRLERAGPDPIDALIFAWRFVASLICRTHHPFYLPSTKPKMLWYPRHLLLLAAASFASVRAAGLCFNVGVPNLFCVYGSPSANSSTLVQMRYEIPAGLTWVGFGIGSSMSSADVMFVAINADGTTTLTRRTASEFALPSVASVSGLTLVPASTGQFNVNNVSTTVVTFVRSTSDPTGSNNPITLASQSFIYAARIGAAGGPLVQHQISSTTSGSLLDGSLQYQSGAVNNVVTSGGGSNYDQLMHAHGIMMAVAWVLAAPLAVLVARYGKSIGVWWFRIHVALMLCGAFCLTYVAFGLAYSAVGQIGEHHFDTTDSTHGAHVILGLIVVILTGPQTILGFVIDKLWSPSRKTIPWWDMTHWWTGRILGLAAIINVPIGIYLRNDNPNVAYALYGIWVGLVFIGGAVLQVTRGQAHHVELEDTTASSASMEMR
ncbi:hypothetical protein BDK51DRAFT_41381 [Blyttiomyces helicus]|uniref:Cytochrome b561 domain-containing protein n=1 Tax=Blyttiomyces helicus TaxID=388810 RepID=A0A4P9WHH8_9FUNG|nr:hypothetical protein BDK51DRAFT_41381 [Blyttiomyces helicus]|eukprot:RKO92279.1 hypothetical protein BDK51DRAFT_41381 [Blyttiomyces helicus]